MLLPACSAIAVSATSPKIVLILADSPIAQAAVLGRPANIKAEEIKSTTPLISQPIRIVGEARALRVGS